MKKKNEEKKEEKKDEKKDTGFAFGPSGDIFSNPAGEDDLFG